MARAAAARGGARVGSAEETQSVFAVESFRGCSVSFGPAQNAVSQNQSGSRMLKAATVLRSLLTFAFMLIFYVLVKLVIVRLLRPCSLQLVSGCE